MPPALQEGMHEREVVEWLQTDTNLVGCIERKARVVKARSYEEVRTFGGSGVGPTGGRRLLFAIQDTPLHLHYMSILQA
jgi:hypothetical protein